MDKKVVDATIERLQAELLRRREERIAKGEVIRGPVIVTGHPDSVERAKASALAALRQQGETREVLFEDVITTGVPRPGRDDNVDPWPTSVPENKFTPPSEPQPEPEPEFLKPIPVEPVAQGRVITQLSPPDPARGDPGAVAIGLYTAFSDGTVEVRGEDDQPIGVGHIEPGGDAVAAARAVLRERSKPNPFYGDLPYKKPGTW
jgi:hypothetical protein